MLLRLTSIVLAAIFLVPCSMAQIPEEFKNLQLLDQDIERGDLIATMRDWAGGLGVRCAHCHVGPDNLQGMDFASDEKATKRTARRMLVMARTINKELLAKLPIPEAEGRERAQVVSCHTCHRSQPRPPRQAVMELAEVSKKDGPAAAIDHFRELKAEHSEAGVYDLRPKTLSKLARRYMEQGELDGAREVLSGLFEIEPDFADGYALLAQVEAQAGNQEAAMKALGRALEIDPENRTALWLKRRAEQADRQGQE